MLAVSLALTPLAASAAELERSFSPAPVSSRAEAPGGGFTLGLDAALSAQAPHDRAALDRVASASAPSETSVSNASIATIDLRRVVVPMRQQAPTVGGEPTPTSGGFGKWLKRHWWVPALVGAAVIATAGEELWDDDDQDDED